MMCRMKISNVSICRQMAIALVFAALLSFAQAQEKTIYVDLDYARILRLPEGAQTLVIGNPLIADVTMLKNNRLMVVTGKSWRHQSHHSRQFGHSGRRILDHGRAAQ